MIEKLRKNVSTGSNQNVISTIINKLNKCENIYTTDKKIIK